MNLPEKYELYQALKAERFNLAALEEEQHRPVPLPPDKYVKGTEGMLRLEVLLLRVRAGRAA